jgi:hypothetical protein
MKHLDLKTISILLVIFFFLNTGTLFSQDFYLNKNSDVIYLNNVISNNWIDLNLNESYDFLKNAGFEDIKTNSTTNKEIVTGVLPNKEYIYIRRLVFENKIIKEYSDAIMFPQFCTLCLANDVKYSLKNNPTMNEIVEKGHKAALIEDAELKEKFYKSQRKSLKYDAINQQLAGDITDFGFKFSNSVSKDDFNIYRYCSLELDKNNIYNFYSERRVILNEKNYSVGSYNLRNVNQYDLNLMVDIFLLDCKSHNILVKKGKVNTSFESLLGETLGLSYGINNDDRIELKIDPIKWENSSLPKKWYLIYHELGHDVLNLKHGNGGKMMFNFADKGYSWMEFWEDREYMFNSYKRK